MKRKKSLDNICISDTIIKENLPYSFVHYPSHYRTFIGFSKYNNSTVKLCSCTKRDSTVKLCSCTKRGIEHFVFFLSNRCNTVTYWSENDLESFSWYELEKYFPKVVIDSAIDNQQTQPNNTLIEVLSFEEKICHQCNLSHPSLKYCHPMYGNEFKQNYGWYFNQTYLNLAIDSNLFQIDNEPFAITERCPPKILKIINEILESEQKYWEIGLLHKKFEDSPELLDEYYEKFELNNNTPKLNYDLRKELKKNVENIVRENFGFKRIGEGLIKETLLYQIVCKIFPNENVFRNKKPLWLEGLELDIYIPNLDLALEYQGEQHFHSIEHWGGQEALNALKERDKRKKSLCKKKRINLFFVNYDDPLTEDFVRLLLKL